MTPTLQRHWDLAVARLLLPPAAPTDETGMKDPSVTLWEWPSAASKQTGATMEYLPLVELEALKALIVALFIIRSLLP